MKMFKTTTCVRIEVSACFNLSTTFPLVNFRHIKYTSSVLKFLVMRKFVLVSIGYHKRGDAISGL